MPRTIAVFTSSRADYAHLVHPIRAMLEHPDITPHLYVFGPHLSPDFGATLEQIKQDGLPIHRAIPSLDDGDDDAAMARTLADAAAKLADALAADRPDLIFVPADRYEMLAPASVALTLRIPIIHLEGGEESEGAIDQSVRNALTAMAAVHLTTTQLASNKLVAMGEEAWRVHRVGAPSLDHLVRTPLPSRQELEQVIGLDLSHPTLVVSAHPTTTMADTTHEAMQVVEAVRRTSCQLVWCAANADAGGRRINDAARALCALRDHAVWIDNLDPPRYWSLLHHAAAMVGNSSSIIMESPSLGLPAVNVGIRQQGRERAANVIDAPAAVDDIVRAIDAAMRTPRDPSIANPYGDGGASSRIAELIASIGINEQLIRKRRSL